jgi:formyl-CoA transferase
MGVPLRGAFRTADGGWITISASTPRQQQAVDDLAAGSIGESLRERACAWIAATARDDVAGALAHAGVPSTPVNDLAEMAADPQVAHRRSLLLLDGHTIVRPTPAIDGPATTPAVPALGDANADVLSGWLGLAPGELDGLRDRGVICNDK